MKNLKIKLQNLLKERRGESLIETIIAIMIFSVLMVSVTTMVTSSTNSIRTTQREADAVQETVNAMGTRSLSTTTTPVTITLQDSSAADPALTAVSVPGSAVGMSENDLFYFHIEP